MQSFSPSFFRARIKAFELAINILLPKTDDKKNSPRELLKQGFIHPDIADKMQSLTRENDLHDNTPLSFKELTSYSTWFAMHPEKICGTEKVTTSLFFPIKVEGTQQQIEETVRAGIAALKSGHNPQNKTANAFQFELELLELELELGGLGGLGRNIENEPVKINDSDWAALSKHELIKAGNAFFDDNYKTEKARLAFNYQKSVPIIISKNGFRHSVAMSGSYLNIVLVKKIKQIIERAAFVNMKEKKHNDSKSTKGYLNFVNDNVFVNGERIEVKITVRINQLGKSKIERFYYDHYKTRKVEHP